MTDEEIVEAAKSAEKGREFGKIVRSKASRGVNSAYGIGFIEGAECARNEIMKKARNHFVSRVLSGNDMKNMIEIYNYEAECKFGDVLRVIVLPKED